ncbi:MAG: Mu-like prophage major head subunit gpT family protein [Planctomycetota bacterium]
MALHTLQQNAITRRMFHALNAERTDYLAGLMGPVNPSNQRVESYAGTGAVDPMTETGGEQPTRDSRKVEYDLANKFFQTGTRITYAERLFETWAPIDQKIAGLNNRYQSHWAKLATQLFGKGRTARGYDKHPFFSTTHKEGKSRTQSNLLSQAPTTAGQPTPEEMRSGIYRCIEGMMSLVDDVDEPANEMVEEFLVFYPTKYTQAVDHGIGAEFLGGGDSNVIARNRTFLPVPMPRFGGVAELQDAIVVVANDGMALIRQQVEGPVIRVKGQDSDYEFDNNGDWAYSVNAVRNAGYGSWQKAFLFEFK